MAYRGDDCPKRAFIRKSKAWAFALSLGLLVSISDVKLPGETNPGRQFPEHPVAAEAVLQDAVPGDYGEDAMADALAFVYEPKGEPELLPYDKVVHEAAGRHDVDADLIMAIIMAESQFNPKAKSKRGARGLMQLMPVTADALDVNDVFNPSENVNAGTRHFRWLLDRFEGNLKLALAAYNAGEQNVLRYNGIPPYPETRAYIVRVLENYASLKQDGVEF
jgi:soluble lytic murein transglycosylase-like protein